LTIGQLQGRRFFSGREGAGVKSSFPPCNGSKAFFSVQVTLGFLVRVVRALFLACGVCRVFSFFSIKGIAETPFPPLPWHELSGPPPQFAMHRLFSLLPSPFWTRQVHGFPLYAALKKKDNLLPPLEVLIVRCDPSPHFPVKG